MDEKNREGLTTSDHLDEENKSRTEDVGVENCLQEIAADDDLALQTNTMQELKNHDEEHVLKKKQSRMQSVLSLVRNQLLPQPALEVRKLGMMELVNQITKHLDDSRLVEQEEPRCSEAPPAEVDITEIQDVTSEESESEKAEVHLDECVVLLLEVLKSVDALRKEVNEEMSRLRQESLSQTQMLQAMEKRLTDSFRASAEKNMNSLNTIPPLPGVARRRPLRRTMTTMTMKNTAPTEFRPRCLSEPVRSQAGEKTLAGNINGITHPLRKGAEVQKRLLLPSLITQHNNKLLHPKSKVKPTNK